MTVCNTEGFLHNATIFFLDLTGMLALLKDRYGNKVKQTGAKRNKPRFQFSA